MDHTLFRYYIGYNVVWEAISLSIRPNIVFGPGWADYGSYLCGLNLVPCSAAPAFEIWENFTFLSIQAGLHLAPPSLFHDGSWGSRNGGRTWVWWSHTWKGWRLIIKWCSTTSYQLISDCKVKKTKIQTRNALCLIEWMACKVLQ